MRISRRLVFLICFLALGLASPLHTQSSGRIAGRVTDETGGALEFKMNAAGTAFAGEDPFFDLRDSSVAMAFASAAVAGRIANVVITSGIIARHRRPP